MIKSLMVDHRLISNGLLMHIKCRTEH